MKNFCLLLALITLILAHFNAVAQNNNYAYAKEKIYVQTDHVFYKPGDVMYFKLYLVKGSDQTVSSQSNTAFTEIISPAGTIVKKLALKVNDGYAEGSFDFTTDAVGGVYKIKAYTSWMQNETDSTFFTKEITVQQYIAPRILMKLDYPVKGYGPGDEVLADFSVRNLADEALKFYPGKFTVSIGGSIQPEGRFVTGNTGKYQLQFRLPKNLSSTDGLLNVTMQYDGFTESISRSIPIVLNKIDVQFMPEGGTLVNGLQNFIAFKAVNEFNKPVDIAGFITDKNNKTVASYETVKFGMGKFLLQPEAGQYYTAHITSPANISGTFLLPVADNRGVIMNMQDSSGTLLLKLQSNYPLKAKLVAQCKGIDYLVQQVQIGSNTQIINIDKNKFPAGIAQFTLYDETARPLAERLFFMNTDKLLTLTITPDKSQYQPREKVTLLLETTDENNTAVPANLSISVVDDKLWTMADDKQHNILSWLLLGSELRGRIEEPAFYFKKDEARAAAALDLLMLTHGYRYFDFIPYVLNEGKLKYTGDLENIISGNILDMNGLPAASKVYLVNSVSGSKALFANTGKDGMFFFSNLEPQADYYLIAQSKRRKQEININILQQGIGQNPFKESALYKKEIPADNTKLLPAISATPQPSPVADNKINIAAGLGAKTSALNEVVVTAVGFSRKKDLTGSISLVQNKDLMNARDVSTALAGKVAGVNVINVGNPGADNVIRLRGFRSVTGNSQPLYIINGIPAAGIDASLNVNEIESITVLKDAAATAIYGAAAANGVIIIQEKRTAANGALKFDLSKKHFFATKQIRTAGNLYTVVRKFYAPLYETTATDVRNDFRETIYWNPVVQTDENGKAILSFYNSDATTTFRTIAEGIGYNGLLGNAEKTYSTQALIAADIKVPPYLTTGDRALLPLTIKNNGSGFTHFTVSADSVKGVYFEPFNHTFSLAAGESRQILIPANALAVINDSLSVSIKTNDSRQLLRVPVTVSQKGFPVFITMSGMASAAHTFSINKPVAGSVKATLKLYKDVEGQLLDGIESMLREPYGCFEQTSSTTYPNIFILKYLEESGKINTATRKKAMDYIQRGYKRLIGFETSENGFEWFGHAPAHEALTAYGLLEFTDMQAFVDVDKKMLQRTLDFLLKRRDGNGGFKIAGGGYDRFASVPNKIANLYIVYAITQAGAGKTILPEYETAVNKALLSNDAYQMALMAIAADNMNDAQHYDQLMAKLFEQFNAKKINAETSVVNSREGSLRVESKALFIIAMLRNRQPDMVKAATLLGNIMAEKTYYGYGSTQATVLALQAVLAYARQAGKQAAASDIAFTLNDKKMSIDDMPVDGQNQFDVQYHSNSNIPYEYEVSYFTYTLPSSEKSALQLKTSLSANAAATGETVRLNIAVSNKQNDLQPMAIAKIGIPAGLSLQPWQLKQLVEENKLAYYEIFDNYLVLYWMGFANNETKNILLDLKADIPGTYTAKASNAYLYYTPEYKDWNEGLSIEIK